MATGSVSLINVGSASVLSSSDRIFCNSNSAVKQTSANGAFAQTVVSVSKLLIGNSTAPANSTANVVKGSFWYDTDYLYIATANSVIKRVALSSF